MNWSIGFEPLLSWTWLAAIALPLAALALAGLRGDGRLLQLNS